MKSKNKIPNFSRKPKWLKPLRDSRKIAGYTLDAAAGELGISCSALSRIESGERSLEIVLFEHMCSLYEVLPWALLKGFREEGYFKAPTISTSDRLKIIRKKHKITLNDLACKLGLAQSSLSLIENGKRRLTVKMLTKVLEVLSEHFETFYSPSPASGVTLTERSVIGAAAAGSQGVAEAWGVSEGYSSGFAPAAIANAITLEIDGDSMYPYYRKGDVVFCSPELFPSTGDICVFRFTDSSMVCKKFIDGGKGRIILRSINPKWSDRIVEPDEIEAIWPVVGSYRREKGRSI